MNSFINKVAAITGAGSGIGRALALNLAGQGCNLAISDVNAAGLKIYTTLDRKLQEATGKYLEQALENIEKRTGYRHQKAADYHGASGDKPRYLEGALLVVDNQSGAVLAYHGGRDYTKRQYDAIKDGAFVDENGLRFIGGHGDRDANYIYGMTTLKF